MPRRGRSSITSPTAASPARKARSLQTRSLKLTDALGVPLSQIQKPATHHPAPPATSADAISSSPLPTASSLRPSGETTRAQPCGLFSYVFQKLVAMQNGKITYKELYEGSEYVIKQCRKTTRIRRWTRATTAAAWTSRCSASPDRPPPRLRRPLRSPTPEPVPTASPAPETPPAPTPVPAPASAPVAPPPAPPAPLKVMLLVTDPSGHLLDKCSFAIFKPGVTPVKGEIRREDILMLGTDERERDVRNLGCEGVTIAPGTYPIKVVREGYKTFLSTLEVKQGTKAGYAILAFRLAAE